MPDTTAHKQKTKEGFILLTLQASADFKKKMEALPDEGSVRHRFFLLDFFRFIFQTGGLFCNALLYD